MRKSIFCLTASALVLTACQPLGTLLTAPFGYSFSISNFTVFSVITALIFIALTILSLKQNSAPYSKSNLVIFLITTPLSIIDSFFYIILYHENIRTRASILLLIIPIVCSFYLMLKYAEVKIIKPIILSLSVIMLLMLLPLVFISVFLPTPNTVIKTVYAQDSHRYAEVIDSDQGALGGNTFVDAYAADNPFFKISKRVYEGNWGEWERMSIYWKDEHTLVINSHEYYIK